MMRVILFVLACAGLSIAAITAGVAISSNNGDGVPARLAKINAGYERSVAVTNLTPRQQSDLANSGVSQDSVRLLGERAGSNLYVAESTSNAPCFMASRVDSASKEFQTVACLGAGSQPMPSDSRPLVDFSPGIKRPGEGFLRVRYIAGIAADDVASVGFVDQSGAVFRVPVVNNLYGTDDASLAALKVVAVVAFDANGTEIFRQSTSFPQ
jgi:hypothetical protein